MSSKKKVAARQLEIERGKHKARLVASSGLGSAGISREAVTQSVTAAAVDRLRSCLPTVKDIKRIHMQRQREATIRERLQRSAQLPASRVLPYRWSPAEFVEPSLRPRHPQDKLAELNDEIQSFAKYTCLTKAETEMRETVIRDLLDAVLVKWPRAEIKVFGSFPSGLSIYSSDLDVAVLNLGSVTDSQKDQAVVSSAEKPKSISRIQSIPSLPNSESPSQFSQMSNAVDLSKEEDEEVKVTWSIEVGAAKSNEPGRKEVESIDDVGSGPKRKRSSLVFQEEEERSEYSDSNQSRGGIHSSSQEDESDVEGADNLEANEDLELNLASDDSKSCGRGRLSSAEIENKLRTQNLLHVLGSHLQSMGWCTEMQVRAKARVPIIALTHRCGISVDISLGIVAEDHTSIVHRMIQCGGFLDFYPICSFLKVFLAHLDLDKPFVGGIGSFKLYALIAYVICKYRDLQKTGSTAYDSSHRLAEILRLFFKHWGAQKNLNEHTVLLLPLPQLEGKDEVKPKVPPSKQIEVPLDRVFKIVALQQAFRVADHVLDEIISGSRPRPQQCSLLASLFNVKLLKADRAKHSSVATQYPPYSMRAKMRVAEQVVLEIQRRFQLSMPLTIEQIHSASPTLFTRLLSYRDTNEAMWHLRGGPHINGLNRTKPVAQKKKKREEIFIRR